MSRQVTLAGQAPAGQPTPGPWTFLEDGDAEALHNCRPLTICSPSKDDLAEVFSEEDSTVAIPRQQAIANARLIAASPCLLAELQRCVDLLLVIHANASVIPDPAMQGQTDCYRVPLDDIDGIGEVVIDARAALARATGSQP